MLKHCTVFFDHESMTPVVYCEMLCNGKLYVTSHPILFLVSLLKLYAQYMLVLQLYLTS